MSVAKKTLILLVPFALAFQALGCSGTTAAGDPEETRLKCELTEIYDIYAMFSKAHRRPPRRLADLNQQQYQGIYPVGVNGLRSGAYIAVWGVNVDDEDTGKILAYEKNAPALGGFVLTADGTVRRMSADDLKAVLK